MHGFRSQVQGLQFEWSWQHPLLSRAVRQAVMSSKISGCKLTSRGRQRECRLDSNLRILEAMMRSAPWNMMPLTISFFDAQLMNSLTHSLPESVKIELCASMESFNIDHVTRSVQNDGVDCSAICSTCEQLLALNTQSRVVRCPDCRALFHARCAASCFIRQEPKSLLPSKKGECPVCEKSVLWSDFVRSAFIFEVNDSKASESSSSESSDSDQEPSEDEPEIIDLENSPTVARSPAVKVEALPPPGIEKPTSLRERLFKKTGNSQLFEI